MKVGHLRRSTELIRALSENNIEVRVG